MPSNRSVESIIQKCALTSFSILALCFSTSHAAEVSTATVQSGITLKEAFQRGMQVSEALKISDEFVRQLEFRYKAAVGDILPRVTWNMTQLFEDTSGVENTGSDNQDAPRQRTPASYFMLQQPLFHGFQEFNGLKGVRASQQAERYARQQATLLLLSDIALVFYTSLDLQLELVVLNDQIALTDDRLKELSRRIRLGRSRDSETLSAQVDRVSLQAQIEATRYRWAVARETLKFLTEIPMDQPLMEANPLPTPGPLEQALAKAGQRPDVLAALERERAAGYQIKYARAEYFPSLDFTGRYYTERVGFDDDVDWDALFLLQVPLFQGGSVKARTALARSQQIAQELETSRTRRFATRSIETEHAGLSNNLAQAQAYAQAVELAEKNYKVQQEEYRLGLINNLQVLDVLTTLQNLKIQRLRAEASTHISNIQLRAATGEGL